MFITANTSTVCGGKEHLLDMLRNRIIEASQFLRDYPNIPMYNREKMQAFINSFANLRDEYILANVIEVQYIVLDISQEIHRAKMQLDDHNYELSLLYQRIKELFQGINRLIPAQTQEMQNSIKYLNRIKKKIENNRVHYIDKIKNNLLNIERLLDNFEDGNLLISSTNLALVFECDSLESANL